MANKNLGQHFLLDLNLTARIARAAGDLQNGTTIEIGPGPGGLTRALLDAGARVIAVEKDTRCRPILAELAEAYPGRLTVIEADALAVDAGVLGDAPRRIVSNLPYNIGTELLIRWLKNPGAFESFTLMFQTEVAARITAPPDTGAYGRLSVYAQWLCDIELLFHVNPKAFTPPPQVQSSVVQLHAAHPAAGAGAARNAGARDRGRLRPAAQDAAPESAVAGGGYVLRLTASGLCRAAAIEPTARAETLTVAQFCALANAIDKPETGLVIAAHAVDESDQAGLPMPPQALGGEDRFHVGDALASIS